MAITINTGYRSTTTLAGKAKPEISDVMTILARRGVAAQMAFKKHAKQIVDHWEWKRYKDENERIVTYSTAAYAATATTLVAGHDIATVDDLFHVEGTNEVIKVTAKTTVTWTITRSVGPTAAAPIPINTVLRYIGNARSEAQNAPASYSTIEDYDTFYAQDFEQSLSWSIDAEERKNYTGPDIPYQKGKKLKKVGELTEQAILFGEPLSTTYDQSSLTDGIGLTSAPLYYTEGLLYALRARGDAYAYLTAPATLTEDWFLRYFLGPRCEIGSNRKLILGNGTMDIAIATWNLGRLRRTDNSDRIALDTKIWQVANHEFEYLSHPFLNKADVGASAGAIMICLDMGAPQEQQIKFLERVPLQTNEYVLSNSSVFKGRPKARKVGYFQSVGLAVLEPNIHGALVGIKDFA